MAIACGTKNIKSVIPWFQLSSPNRKPKKFLVRAKASISCGKCAKISRLSKAEACKISETITRSTMVSFRKIHKIPNFLKKKGKKNQFLFFFFHFFIDKVGARYCFVIFASSTIVDFVVIHHFRWIFKFKCNFLTKRTIRSRCFLRHGSRWSVTNNDGCSVQGNFDASRWNINEAISADGSLPGYQRLLVARPRTFYPAPDAFARVRMRKNPRKLVQSFFFSIFYRKCI